MGKSRKENTEMKEKTNKKVQINHGIQKKEIKECVEDMEKSIKECVQKRGRKVHNIKEITKKGTQILEI